MVCTKKKKTGSVGLAETHVFLGLMSTRIDHPKRDLPA